MWCHAVQPALSYAAPELVKGAQQSPGGLFSAADIFSLGNPINTKPDKLACVIVFPDKVR